MDAKIVTDSLEDWAELLLDRGVVDDELDGKFWRSVTLSAREAQDLVIALRSCSARVRRMADRMAN